MNPSASSRPRSDRPGQVEAGGPALGAGPQRGHLAGRQVERRSPPGAGVAASASLKRSVVRADLGQVAPRAQAREADRGVVAARHDDAQRVGQVLDQEGERLVDRGLGDGVDVVEGDDRPRRRRRARRPAASTGRPRACPGLPARAPDGLLVDRHPGALEGLRQVAPEAGRVVVGGIEGQPGAGVVESGEPLADERALAPAGGGAHQRQPVVGHRPPQPVDQPGARRPARGAARAPGAWSPAAGVGARVAIATY